MPKGSIAPGDAISNLEWIRTSCDRTRNALI